MPTCDTSWLYALLDEADVHYREAQDEARGFDVLNVPAVVLGELLQVISFRTRKAHGVAAASEAERRVRGRLCALPEFRLQHAFDDKLAAKIHDRHPSISYVDAVVIASSLRSGERVVTFDHGQREAWEAERARI